ncbi:MAG: SGNH/GDSL hydrolase family protein [Variovorax sp.]
MATAWAQGAPAATPRWTASWAAAPQLYLPPPATAGKASPTAFRDQTVRQRVFPTVGGDRIRVRFSNLFGSAPLHIAEAGVARSTGGDAISTGTLQPLHFAGARGVTIAPGAEVWSDAAPLRVRAGQAVAVSFHLDVQTAFATAHHLPLGATWVAPGNAVRSAKLPGASASEWNHVVTGLDVVRTGPTRVVVAFGDSITEGVNGFGPLQGRYPDRLAERLRDPVGGAATVAVLNAGIAGNRLLSDWVGPSGASRFARDVLGQSGVTHVIVLIGINDIGLDTLGGPAGGPVPVGSPVTADQLTAGLQRLVDMARERGVKVLLGTLLPMKGSGYWTAANEARRQAVNRWIRGRQQVDAVVDFDAALRDANDPLALDSRYDSGDHLHPADAGYAAMATAVDLGELRE